MDRLILASGSPRRRELLENAGFVFEIVPAEGEECITSTDPAETVQELALQKAQEVYVRMTAEGHGTEAVQDGCKAQLVVIGADTVVAADGRIMGKPADKADAFAMLKRLSGSVHEVYTGVAVLSDEKKETFVECTRVSFYEMTDAEIREYIESGDPMDKAGAYGIQSGAAKYIRGIEGDYNNVVGLPLARLYHVLKDFMRCGTEVL